VGGEKFICSSGIEKALATTERDRVVKGFHKLDG